MDYKKNGEIHITPEVKPIVKDKNKKVTVKHEQKTSLSEMDLLKEVNRNVRFIINVIRYYINKRAFKLRRNWDGRKEV